MEKLKALIGKKENRIDFLRDLIALLLSREDVYSSDVLFRDAVEEIHSILRSEILSGKLDLIDAYETAVLLKAVVFSEILEPNELLRKLLDQLG